MSWIPPCIAQRLWIGGVLGYLIAGKGLLLGLFFISVGMALDVGVLIAKAV